MVLSAFYAGGKLVQACAAVPEIRGADHEGVVERRSQVARFRPSKNLGSDS